jgi:hypothetical protein
MAGRYGYTAPTNGSAFDVPGDIADVYSFWDSRVGESVATVAGMPAASARPAGHVISVLDGTNAIYLNLGTAGSAGTSWHLVHYFQDWTTVTATNGWTANTGSGTPQVSRVGNTVYFRGGLYGGTNNTQACILPSWARPTRTVRVPMTKADDTIGLVRLFTNGELHPSSNIHSETQLPPWSVT